MVLELERADRVRDALDRVRDRVRVVVGRVDAPGVAGAVMRGLPDPVQRRIAHVDVGRRHVDRRAQHVRAVGELAGAHAPEHVQVLGHRPRAMRAVAPGLGQRAAVLADLVGRQAVHVGVAAFDQPLRQRVHLLEVVRGVEQPVVPVEAEPADVLLDRVHVLDVFLRRVGVVEPQVAQAAELGRRRRSSGRSTWRGRCAGSRWASGGNRVCTRPPWRPARRSSVTISRMKSSGPRGLERRGAVGHEPSILLGVKVSRLWVDGWRDRVSGHAPSGPSSVSTRGTVSIGSAAGISGLVVTSSSRSRRALTSTRLSNEPAAWL